MASFRERVKVAKGARQVVPVTGTPPGKPALNPVELKNAVLHIYAICRETHPDKEPELPALLRRYRGQEDQLLARLKAKPDLLLRLRKSYVPKRPNLTDSELSSSAFFNESEKIVADLIQFLSAQRPEIYNAYEETKKGSQNTKKTSSSSSSGSGLFASIRDSLVVPNDNLAATDVEKKESEEDKRFDGNGEDGEDLSPQPVTAGVLSDPNDNRMNDAEEESEETKAQKMEQSRISIFSMAIPTSLRSLVENVPFYEIAQADRLDHLSKLPVSIFNTDAKLGNDGQYPAALSSSLTFPPPAATASSSPSFTPPSRPFASFDQAACIMSLPSTREKAAIVELLSLEDAAAVLTELRLRGDYDDVLAALLPAMRLAVQQLVHLRADPQPSLADSIMEEALSDGRNDETRETRTRQRFVAALKGQLLLCPSAAEVAVFLQACNLRAASALLWEMHRRSAPGSGNNMFALAQLSSASTGFAAMSTNTSGREMPDPEDTFSQSFSSAGAEVLQTRAMTAGGGAAILAHLSPTEQGALLSCMSGNGNDVSKRVTMLCNMASQEAMAEAVAEMNPEVAKDMLPALLTVLSEQDNDGGENAREDGETENMSKSENFLKALELAKTAKEDQDMGGAEGKFTIQRLSLAEEVEGARQIFGGLLKGIGGGKADPSDEGEGPETNQARRPQEKDDGNTGEGAGEVEPLQNDVMQRLSAVTQVFDLSTALSKDDDAKEGSSVYDKESEGDDTGAGIDEAEAAAAAAAESLKSGLEKALKGATTATVTVAAIAADAGAGAVSAAAAAAAEGEAVAGNNLPTIGASLWEEGGGESTNNDKSDGQTPELAEKGEANEDEENVIIDRASNLSEATTDLSGVSETDAKDAEDGSAFDNMVWTYLMAGLPADEQARMARLEEEKLMRKGEKAPPKHAFGSNMTGAEMAEAVLKMKNEEKQQHLRQQQQQSQQSSQSIFASVRDSIVQTTNAASNTTIVRSLNAHPESARVTANNASVPPPPPPLDGGNGQDRSSIPSTMVSLSSYFCGMGIGPILQISATNADDDMLGPIRDQDGDKSLHSWTVASLDLLQGDPSAASFGACVPKQLRRLSEKDTSLRSSHPPASPLQLLGLVNRLRNKKRAGLLNVRAILSEPVPSIPLLTADSRPSIESALQKLQQPQVDGNVLLRLIYNGSGWTTPATYMSSAPASNGSGRDVSVTSIMSITNPLPYGDFIAAARGKPFALDISSAASTLFSPQDAKLLSSKWGISVTEIKLIATQFAILSTNGLTIDARAANHALNRLGLLASLDKAHVPRMEKTKQQADSLLQLSRAAASGNTNSAETKDGESGNIPNVNGVDTDLIVDGCIVAKLTAFELAESFGRASFAMAERMRDQRHASHGHYGAEVAQNEANAHKSEPGDPYDDPYDTFRGVLLEEAISIEDQDTGRKSRKVPGSTEKPRVVSFGAARRVFNYSPSELLTRDPLAGLGPLSDHKLAQCNAVFREMVGQSTRPRSCLQSSSSKVQGGVSEPAEDEEDKEATKELTSTTSGAVTMEARLLGRALRRVGFGRPTALQAQAVKRAVGVDILASRNQYVSKLQGAEVLQNNLVSGEMLAKDRMSLFDFLAAISAMLNPEIDPLSEVLDFGKEEEEAAAKTILMAKQREERAAAAAAAVAAGSPPKTDELEDSTEDAKAAFASAVLEAREKMEARRRTEENAMKRLKKLALTAEAAREAIGRAVRSTAKGRAMNMFGGTSANIKSHVMEQQTSDEEGERLLQGPEGDFFDSIGGLMAEAFDDTFGEDTTLSGTASHYQGGVKAGLLSGHYFNGAQVRCLECLFEDFAESMIIHRVESTVLDRGFRSCLRAMGCFPLEFQLNALRDRYGGLARAVSFDKFVVLVMDLHHWFPLATPYRIVAIASRYQPEAAAATGSGGMLAEVTNSHISSDGMKSQRLENGEETSSKLEEKDETVAKPAMSKDQQYWQTGDGRKQSSFMGWKIGGHLSRSHAKKQVSRAGALALTRNAAQEAPGNVSVGDVSKLEHAFHVYDYDHDGVLSQLALRALLRRLQVNWSVKQFVRLARSAVCGGRNSGVWPDFDLDDFVELLTATSDQDMASVEEAGVSKVGVSVANHHARILYGPFSVVWNLHPAQITLIQRTFFEELLSHAHRRKEELKSRRVAKQTMKRQKRKLLRSLSASSFSHSPGSGGALAMPSKEPVMDSGRNVIPRSRARAILSALGINYARIEASGLSLKFNISANTSNDDDSGDPESQEDHMFDFDELLGIIADVVHTYGASLVAVATTTQYSGDDSNDDSRAEATTDDPLSTLRDQEVVNLREVFFALAIDPSTLKAETKHCVTALRQLKLVKSEIELERVLRISGMLPQYRSGWMSWPAFLRFAAHLRHEFSRADRLKNTASAAANLPPPRYLIQQAMASPPTSDTAKIGSTSLKSTLGTSLLQTTGKGYAKKVTGATQSLKAANADDMEIIRGELQIFVDDHKGFESYMHRLNHTYGRLQQESAKVVPTRPPEPAEAPLTAAERRRAGGDLTGLLSITNSRSKGGIISSTSGGAGGGKSSSFVVNQQQQRSGSREDWRSTANSKSVPKQKNSFSFDQFGGGGDDFGMEGLMDSIRLSVEGNGDDGNIDDGASEMSEWEC